MFLTNVWKLRSRLYFKLNNRKVYKYIRIHIYINGNDILLFIPLYCSFFSILNYVLSFVLLLLSAFSSLSPLTMNIGGYIQQDIVLPPSYSIITQNYSSVKMTVYEVTWSDYNQWRTYEVKNPITFGKLLKTTGK